MRQNKLNSQALTFTIVVVVVIITIIIICNWPVGSAVVLKEAEVILYAKVQL
jgi:hypothetical protein